MKTVLQTVLSLGSFATVNAVRAAGHSDADILAADKARTVCLKKASASNLPSSELIVDGPHKFAFVTA